MNAAAQDPTALAVAALDVEFARLDRLLEREILRLRARYELSLDEFRGLYISDRQVDELIGARAGNGGDGALRLAADRVAPDSHGVPWQRLAAALGLDDDMRDLVLLALAPEYDPKYEVLFAYLNNDVTRKLPTAELAGRVFGSSRAHRVAVRGALGPEAPLLRHGVLEVVSSHRDLPRAQRGFRLAPPLIDWLLGLPWCDERLNGLATIAVEAAADVGRMLAPDTARTIERAAAWIIRDGGVPTFVCTAPTAAEGALSANAIFAVAGVPTLSLDLAALRASPTPADALAAAELMQRVLGVGIVASPLEALFDAEQRVIEGVAAPLRRLCMRAPAVALAAGSGVRWRELLGEVRTFEIRGAELAVEERAQIWRAMMGETVGTDVLEALADRFVLGADRIARAVRMAHDATAFDGCSGIQPRALYDAARAVSADAAMGVTHPVETPFEWKDLVVPVDLRDRLTDLVRAVELRPRVLGDWGFAARLGTARGIRVLFAGASGTGKTMAAAIIAKTLGLDLHRIDLAATISKYIGETEKNLERAFAAARRANAILFIDEADALLGKRSEVKDAHDRYANVEVAYLLQRMEDHDGVVILATNLAQNIDDAFSRRMQFVVEFPVPDAASREALWRG